MSNTDTEEMAFGTEAEKQQFQEIEVWTGKQSDVLHGIKIEPSGKIAIPEKIKDEDLLDAVLAVHDMERKTEQMQKICQLTIGQLVAFTAKRSGKDDGEVISELGLVTTLGKDYHTIRNWAVLARKVKDEDYDYRLTMTHMRVAFLENKEPEDPKKAKVYAKHRSRLLQKTIKEGMSTRNLAAELKSKRDQLDGKNSDSTTTAPPKPEDSHKKFTDFAILRGFVMCYRAYDAPENERHELGVDPGNLRGCVDFFESEAIERGLISPNWLADGVPDTEPDADGCLIITGGKVTEVPEEKPVEGKVVDEEEERKEEATKKTPKAKKKAPSKKARRRPATDVPPVE